MMIMSSGVMFVAECFPASVDEIGVCLLTNKRPSPSTYC